MKIIYVGNDLSYWGKIQNRFNQKYVHLSPAFFNFLITDDFDSRSAFVKIYRENFDIIYIDFSTHKQQMLLLMKLINRNNELRLKSTVALHPYNNDRWESVKRTVISGVRLNHFKSSEIHDVVYDPVSLLNVNLGISPEFIRAETNINADLYQIFRISYITEDHFHVETNSPLKVGQFIDVDRHPLEELMPCKRFRVEAKTEKNLYYNMRYAFDLKYMYDDSDFFRATEKDYFRWMDTNGNPEEFGSQYQLVRQDVAMRNSFIYPVYEKIVDWISSHDKEVVPKRVKVLVVDGSLSIFMQIKKETDLAYALNVQTKLTKNMYQVGRTMPQLIVFHYEDNTNNWEEFNKMMSAISEIEDYKPYVLIFNTDKTSSELRDAFTYQRLICHKEAISLEQINNMATKIHQKLTPLGPRVYFETSSLNNVVVAKHKITIVAMMESVIYFETIQEIPMWTVFEIRYPVRMLLTIVPHKATSNYKKVNGCYRALINATGETEKAKIRSEVQKMYVKTLGERD